MRAVHRHFLLSAVFGFAFSLVAPHFCAAQDLSASARALGRQIVISVGIEKRVALQIRNLSSLSPSAVDQARAALETELRSQTIRLSSESEVDATVRVTLSENPESYLLVAEIHRRDSSEVAIVEASRVAAVPAMPAEALPLERTLLLEQPERILDVTLIAGENAQPAAMLVLEPVRVALYTREASRWQFRQSQPLPQNWPWPRDLRGRLAADANVFRVYLPGMICSGGIAPGLTVDCKAAAEPWPVTSGARRLGVAEFSARRNFFTGKVAFASGENLEFPPFFSAAPVEEQGATLWVMTGVDARARIQRGTAQPAPLPVVWGSDIAGVQSDCGGGPLVLAAQASENGDSAIAAYRYTGGQFVAASRPMTFPGSVTALWSDANASAAVVVSRNHDTGNYEAYSLAIACKR